MLKISPDKLQPGMKLVKPVISNNGMVLLGEGMELTEKWIQRIVDMGIENLYVEGSQEPAVPKEELLAQLEARFKYIQDCPYMVLINKAVSEHIEAMYE